MIGHSGLGNTKVIDFHKKSTKALECGSRFITVAAAIRLRHLEIASCKVYVFFLATSDFAPGTSTRPTPDTCREALKAIRLDEKDGGL